jgi:Rps23 Pro-64 3,4-dihydroxylase Tpa1-like proline 4-hydroxylase
MGINYLDYALWLKQSHDEAEPFPWTMLDGFFADHDLAGITEAILAVPAEHWQHDDHIHQVNKSWLSDLDKMPASVRSCFEQLHSGAFLRFLENLTGFKSLHVDAGLLGGGVHRTERGGRLEIHSDYPVHLKTGLMRRLNCLLFLNKDWCEVAGGHLEFWGADMKRCIKRIEPLFNRAVIFNTTETSFHGQPYPWRSDTPRLSLAVYYYQAHRSGESRKPKLAQWQKRPEVVA